MSKVLVTGGTGMAGLALKEVLPDAIYVGSEFDLRDMVETRAMFKLHRPEVVIHMAAKVGGIKANMNAMSDFYVDNILINTNVLKCCHDFNVKKTISLLSTCVYSHEAPLPLKEKDMHSGECHPSNYGYGFAKRMLDIQSRSYREQYGENFICLIPNNLYGEHDNFHLINSHVIPSLIRKIYEAKKNNADVKLWGDGTPMREFTYAKDLAKIIVFAMNNYDGKDPINVGNTNEISIKNLVEIIAEIFNYQGKIIWDTNQTNGLNRKPSDNSNLLNLGWKKEYYTNLREGLKATCDWFVANYPNVRGCNE